MRNLKRALCVALSSIMLMGMSVMGVSAAASDYDDVKDNASAYAIDLVSELGVMTGKGDGFNPEGNLTRAEMMVIMTALNYGAGYNVNQFAGMPTNFTDVPAWAAGYVNLAVSLGITSGTTATTFSPDAPVTAAQAALFITKALGYFQNSAEFKGNWELAAVTKASELDIMDNVNVPAKAYLTREQVAVMIYNALTSTKATTVMYNDMFKMYYNTDDIFAGVKAIGDRDDNGRYFDVETIGMKVFDMNGGDTVIVDNMGRPTVEWTVDRDVVATKVFEADAIYFEEDDRDDIKDDFNIPAIDGVNNDINVNDVGVELATYTGDLAYGEVAEIYEVGNRFYVAEYAYAIGEVEDVDTNKDDERFIEIDGTSIDYVTKDFEEGDIVVYTTNTVAGTDDEITFIAVAEKVEGEYEGSGSDYITVDGEDYKIAVANVEDNADLGKDAIVRIYLDPNGNVASAKVVEKGEGESSKYLYVAGAKYDDWSGELTLKVVFDDGSEEEINVVEVENIEVKDLELTSAFNGADDWKDSADYIGNIFTYSETDGEYDIDEATSVTPVTDVTIENGENDVIVAETDFKLNNKTIIVDNDTNEVYVGYDEVLDYTDSADNNVTATYAKDDDGDVVVLFITGGEADDKDANDYVVIVDADKYKDSADGKTRTFLDAYVDGEKTEVVVKKGTESAKFTDLTVVELVKVDADDVVTSANVVVNGGTTVRPIVDVDDGSTPEFTTADGDYKVDEDTVYVVIDATRVDLAEGDDDNNDLVTYAEGYAEMLENLKDIKVKDGSLDDMKEYKADFEAEDETTLVLFVDEAADSDDAAGTVVVLVYEEAFNAPA